MIKDNKFFEQLKVYLGKYDVTFSKEELEYFTTLDLQKKSYVVFCKDYDILKKFVNTYLLCTNSDYYNYITYSVSELLEYKFSKTPVTYSELMIINYPSHTLEKGETANFIRDVLLDIVVNRNRFEDCYTLILAEKELDYFKEMNSEIESIYIQTNSTGNKVLRTTSKNENRDAGY